MANNENKNTDLVKTSGVDGWSITKWVLNAGVGLGSAKIMKDFVTKVCGEQKLLDKICTGMASIAAGFAVDKVLCDTVNEFVDDMRDMCSTFSGIFEQSDDEESDESEE